MAAKERHAAAFITLLLMVLHSSAEEDSAPAGKKVYVDIFKFLNTDDPILSFTISRSSGNPCKVDFYRNTTASGTLFERFYWAPNRRTNLEQMFHDSLKGVFQNSGTAAPEVLNTMYVSKVENSKNRKGKSPKSVDGQRSRETTINYENIYSTEMIEYQDDDDKCAVFAIKPGGRGAMPHSYEFRIRASAVADSSGHACFSKVQEFVDNFPNERLQAPQASMLTNCRNKCEVNFSCRAYMSPGHQ
uniref:Putative lipocalin-3 1 n=1 Tax=Amblyomma triste TaxID=251400 RepID=A0A023GEF4_AMBTT